VRVKPQGCGNVSGRAAAFSDQEVNSGIGMIPSLRVRFSIFTCSFFHFWLVCSIGKALGFWRQWA